LALIIDQSIIGAPLLKTHKMLIYNTYCTDIYSRDILVTALTARLITEMIVACWCSGCGGGIKLAIKRSWVPLRAVTLSSNDVNLEKQARATLRDMQHIFKEKNPDRNPQLKVCESDRYQEVNSICRLPKRQ